MFFRMIGGDLRQPETIEIEVIDFFLMDIGSSSFTSTKYAESGADLMDYQMQTDGLMEDGVRTGYCHSHHNMGTFYSGDDVDDMVVNTKDKDVDYYVTMIINNKGNWIARLAFRVEEFVKQRISRKFHSTLSSMPVWNENEKAEFTETALVMVPLTVNVDGYETVNNERFEKLEKIREEKWKAKKEEDAKNEKANPWKVLAPIPNRSNKEGQQDLFVGKGVQEEMSNDALMGKLMAGSLTFSGGLDRAVKLFLAGCSDKEGKPYAQLIKLHAQLVIDNAIRIVEASEGGSVSSAYVGENLLDLNQVLIQDYMFYDKHSELMPDSECIDMFTDELEALIQPEDGSEEENENENLKTAHHESRQYPSRDHRERNTY